MTLKSLVKLSSAVVAIICSSQAYAQNCSTINILGGEIDNSKYIAELVGHNGKGVAINPKKYRSIARGDYPYYLAEGEHTLSLKLWKKRQYLKHTSNYLKKVNTNAFYTKKKVKAETKSLDVLVNIKPQQTYRFKLSSDQANNPVLTVDSTENKECLSGSATLYAAKNRAKKIQLPQAITAKWSSMAASIKQVNPESLVKQYQPISFSTFIGFTLSNDVANKKLVTYVATSTFADKIGLKVNDVIVSYGNESEQSATDSRSFTNYFQTLVVGKSAVLKVNRNGHTVTLTEKYMPDVVPEATYELFANSHSANNLINAKKLDKETLTSINQLLLETSDAFIKQGITGRVFIEVPVIGNETFKVNMDLQSLVETRGYLAKNQSSNSLYYSKMFIDHQTVNHFIGDAGASRVEAMAERGSQ